MKKFSNGDVVCLKSGGPKMTVKEYYKKKNLFAAGYTVSETEVVCTWFENDQLNQNIFDQEQLQAA